MRSNPNHCGRVCGYLYAPARASTAFYGVCPVLHADHALMRANRAVPCTVTADTLAFGLNLLGIQIPVAL